MRKQFQNRVRLVLYMDSTDLARIEKAASLTGKSVVNFARNMLLNGLVSQPERESDAGGNRKNVRRAKDISVGERSASASGGLDAEPIYKSHSKGCTCFLCSSARAAGLKK